LGRSWDRCHTLAGQRTEGGQLHDSTRWKLPFPNVWFGVSIENQQRADERREALRAAPAAVKFVSYEPALGPVNWDGWEFVDQIISGGESGDDARPSHPEWHRATRDFCQAHSIPYFFKQWGEWLPGPQVGTRFSDDALTRFKVREVSTPTMQGGLCTNYCFRVGKSAAGRILDGQTWDEMPKVTA
jgi:protein gp37